MLTFSRNCQSASPGRTPSKARNAPIGLVFDPPAKKQAHLARYFVRRVREHRLKTIEADREQAAVFRPAGDFEHFADAADPARPEPRNRDNLAFLIHRATLERIPLTVPARDVPSWAPVFGYHMVAERAGRPPVVSIGGKSGLDRARWWLTATGGDPRESATENNRRWRHGDAGASNGQDAARPRPRVRTGKGEKVR